MTAPDCLCDAFRMTFIPSTAKGVRPPTWRPLSEHPGARFAPDLDCMRRDDLILAWCTACGRRWYLSWDKQEDSYHAVPLGDEMLGVLNLEIALPRLEAFLLGEDYEAYSWALGSFVDRFFWEASYDASDAAARLRSALSRPELRSDVRSSLTHRLASVVERESRRERERRPRRGPAR